MITLQNSTPEVYYQQSRDFQFIGRLFDIVINNVNTNTDLIYALPLSANSDSRLIDLMTMTLGFKANHKYNVKQLTSLCSAFTYILRNKGNIEAIETAILTLFNAEGISLDRLEYDLSKQNVLRLVIPEQLSNINLLIDLMDYILPAGLSYELVRTMQRRLNIEEDMTRLKTDSSINFGYARSDSYKIAKATADATGNLNFNDYVAKDQNHFTSEGGKLKAGKEGIYTQAVLSPVTTIVQVQQPEEAPDNGETQETDTTTD